MDCPKEISDFLFFEFHKYQILPSEIFLKVSQHRRNPVVKDFAVLCSQLIEAYKNCNYNVLNNGEYFVLQRMCEYGIRFNTIIDVGASKGDWSIRAIEQFPDAKIHCFEIIPDVFKSLCKNIHSNNAVVNNYGLLNVNGEVDVQYCPNNSELSSVIHFPLNEETTSIKVRMMKGDDYLKKLQISHIDFLKLDVEGAEPYVLEGFSESIDRNAIDMIQFEYGKVNILTKYLLYDFYRYFTSKGYQIGKIYPNYVDFRDYDFNQEDFLGPCYLAVSNRRREIINLLKS